MENKSKNGRYAFQYPLNIRNDEKEIKLYERFMEVAESNFSNRRMALLQAMSLYVREYGDKE